MLVPMTAQPRLSNTALFALSFAYLTSDLANGILDTAGWFFGGDRGEFSRLESLPSIAAVTATPLIAVLIRRRPLWPSLVAAHVLMFVGMASLFIIDGPWLIAQISFTVIALGHQVLAAVLLISAWRATPAIAGVLAGVFVLPRILNQAVVIEVLESDTLFGWAPLLIVSGCLLLIGALATWSARSAEWGRVSAGETSLDRSTVVGASLTLLGLALASAAWGSFDGGAPTGLAVLATGAGLVILGVTQQNRRAPAPMIHLDRALLVFCGVAVALAVWADFGSTFLSNSSSNLSTGVTVSFENGQQWSRFISSLVIITTIPLVAFFATRNRRSLSVGAIAIAAAAILWVFFVLADLELELGTSIALTLLNDWGLLIILGGAIALALKRSDEASIEGGLVIVLASLTLFEGAARQLPYELLVDDLLESGFEDTDPVRLLTVASAVGLVWIAAWWALRPDGADSDSLDSDRTEDGEESEPRAMIET